MAARLRPPLVILTTKTTSSFQVSTNDVSSYSSSRSLRKRCSRAIAHTHRAHRSCRALVHVIFDAKYVRRTFICTIGKHCKQGAQKLSGGSHEAELSVSCSRGANGSGGPHEYISHSLYCVHPRVPLPIHADICLICWVQSGLRDLAQVPAARQTLLWGGFRTSHNVGCKLMPKPPASSLSPDKAPSAKQAMVYVALIPPQRERDVAHPHFRTS